MTVFKSTGDIRRELSRLRENAAISGGVHGRTSVLTLVAWVPPDWQAAADQTLEGLARGHPSRALMLMPRAAAGDGSWSAKVELRPLDGPWEGRAAEVITVSLPPAARGAASIVVPLLRSDLPVFLRWRGPL
ncbi:MAG: glucose-6-phosphate dehydrogenase assembly protein OpcA, partial [Gaiellaceae bacterium]